MLIVPADSSYTRGHWALVTWALVALNTLVFLAAGHHDSKLQAEALDYYTQAQLGAYEFPSYLDTLRSRGDQKRLELLQKLAGAEAGTPQSKVAAEVMLADQPFQEALDADHVITPESPRYAQWKALRQPLRQITARAWTTHLSLRPDAPRPWTLFTHQFLHAGWDHLIGNMVVLVLVGRLVECAIGGLRYLAAYLLTGACAGLAFVAVNHHAQSPLVGASGAISGVMGLFAVTFAGRRIRFFYSLIAFVGFVRLPALWLLPYWIGWEMLQKLLSHGSHVAYEAHAGLLLRSLPDRARTEEKLAAPEQEQAYEKNLRTASELIARMQVERARPLLESLSNERPQDPRPLRKLYLLAKLAPDSAEYHDITARVLSSPASSPEMKALMEEVRGEYLVLARPAPRLPGPLLLQLLEHCAVRGDIAGADRVLKPLIAAGGGPRAGQALLRLARVATPEKARGYQALAARHFS